MTSEIGPDYRQVMNLIRDKITSGDWPVEQQIPSTVDLCEMTGLSITSVRRAVQQLQADGILEGHPGKGVFVKALPEDADRERQDLRSISEQLNALYEKLGQAAEKADIALIREDVAAIRQDVGRLEANVIELYTLTGNDYPHGGAHDSPEAATTSRRRRR